MTMVSDGSRGLTASAATGDDQPSRADKIGELPSISYNDGDARHVIYTLPPTLDPNRDSVLFFTAPKSGTVLLSQLLGHLAPHAGVSFVYIIGEFFKLGIPPGKAPASTSAIFLPKGYCYGFPYLPTEFEIPIIGKVKTLLLVRDPRDMLVSLYYSLRISHPDPGEFAGSLKAEMTMMPGRTDAQTTDIDEFAVQYANDIDYTDVLRRYRELAELSEVTIFRYEDVIYDKARWVAEICTYLGWNISVDVQCEAVAKVDVFPEREEPDKHIRQVHPRNYKKKLKIEAIRLIEDVCADEMAFFGYERYSPLP